MSIPQRALPQVQQRNVPIGMGATSLPPLPGGLVATDPEEPAFCPLKGKQMNRLSLALVITMAGAGIAVADTFNPTEMSQGLDMLQLQLNNMISIHGIDVNVDELTVAQVAEVIARVNDGADTKQEIEEAIELARSR